MAFNTLLKRPANFLWCKCWFYQQTSNLIFSLGRCNQISIFVPNEPWGHVVYQTYCGFFGPQFEGRTQNWQTVPLWSLVVSSTDGPQRLPNNMTITAFCGTSLPLTRWTRWVQSAIKLCTVPLSLNSALSINLGSIEFFLKKFGNAENRTWGRWARSKSLSKIF